MNSKRNMLAYDRSSTGLWVALIFLVSLNLRPAIAAVGPVLAQMGTDLAWGEGVQGVLTAIPLIAFAAVSPLVTFLARRIGIDMSILLALLCIAAGRRHPLVRRRRWHLAGHGGVRFRHRRRQRSGSGDRKT